MKKAVDPLNWLKRLSLASAVTVASAGANAQGIPMDSPGIPVIDLAEAASKLPVVPPELAAYLQQDPEVAERFRRLQAAEYNRNKSEALRRARTYRASAPRAQSASSSTLSGAVVHLAAKRAAGK